MKALLLLLMSVLAPNESARILAIWPVPSLSHQVVFRPLMVELAKRGHEVVVITPDPIKDVPANMTEIDVHDISYNYWRDRVVPTLQGNSKSSLKQLEVAMFGTVNILEEQFKTKEVQDLLKSGQMFDLIFVEAIVKSAAILSHVFKAPVILFSSFSSLYPQLEMIGAPSHINFFPEMTRKRLYNLSLCEKLEEVYEELAYRSMIGKLKGAEDAMIERLFGPDAPKLDDLSESVHMLFLNVHPLWTENRPMPPSVIYTGGIHLKPEKELPTDLKSYLDNSKHGVIYISFGTNVDPTILSPERIKIFCDVFSRMPYDVLWKWNGDELPGKPKNVRISKWLPQSDLLRHPKIKAFLMQGGLQSTDEAILAGVPMIAFPFLGDQWYNAEKYEALKIGLQLDFETFTEEDLERYIKAVIEDKSYKENIIKLRDIMFDQPQTPLERAVWWTEHVIRHGSAKHLRSPMANSTWSEYLILDVVLTILGAVSLVLGAVFLVLFKIYSFFTKKNAPRKLKKK